MASRWLCRLAGWPAGRPFVRRPVWAAKTLQSGDWRTDEQSICLRWAAITRAEWKQHEVSRRPSWPLGQSDESARKLAREGQSPTKHFGSQRREHSSSAVGRGEERRGAGGENV